LDGFQRFHGLPLTSKLGAVKFSLIDLNGVNPNKAEGASHRERLSERTSQVDDATVCSYRNKNYKNSAEMTESMLVKRSNKRRFGFFFDGLALPVGGY
jgi:hypothetical protein